MIIWACPFRPGYCALSFWAVAACSIDDAEHRAQKGYLRISLTQKLATAQTMATELFYECVFKPGHALSLRSANHPYNPAMKSAQPASSICAPEVCQIAKCWTFRQ